MNTRLALLSAFALFAAPALPACGNSSPSDWTPSGSGSSSGGGGAGEGGVDSGSPPMGGGTRDSGSPVTSHDASVDGGEPPVTGDDSGSEGGTSDAPSEGGVVTPATKVTMYLPNWNGSFSSWATMIDFNKMTHLLLAFGTVTGSNNWDLGAADSDVQALSAAAHAANVKVLVSIGGADGDISIINAYGSASNIGPLVSNLDAMVSRLNLDGVDVDLERGGMMQSSSNYPAFVSQLLSTFHPEGKLVTTALAQYIVQDANPDPTITATVQSFDFINDMIYTTNISDYTNEANWWTSQIQLPNDKLVWGVLFGNGLSVGTVTQIATASKAYGGIMCWEYTQSTESTLWPAIQSVF